MAKDTSKVDQQTPAHTLGHYPPHCLSVELACFIWANMSVCRHSISIPDDVPLQHIQRAVERVHQTRLSSNGSFCYVHYHSFLMPPDGRSNCPSIILDKISDKLSNKNQFFWFDNIGQNIQQNIQQNIRKLCFYVR